MRMAAFLSGFAAMGALVVIFPPDAHDIATAAFLGSVSILMAVLSKARGES